MYQILLVDDEPIFLDYLQQIIRWEDCGCRVCGSAQSGEAALSLINSLRPDILILDIQMSRMNGLEVCEVIRDWPVSPRVIIMTAHDEFHFAHQAIKLKVTDYLLKPFDADELTQALRKCIADIGQDETFQQLQHSRLRQRREAALRGALESAAPIPEEAELPDQTGCLVAMLRPAERGEAGTYALEPLLASQFGEGECYPLKREHGCLVVAHLLAARGGARAVEAGYLKLLEAAGSPLSAVALGGEADGLCNLRDSYAQAKAAMENRAKLSGQLVRYEALQNLERELLSFSPRDVELLIRHYEAKAFDRVDALIDRIFGLTVDRMFSSQYVLVAFHTIAIHIRAHFQSRNPETSMENLLSAGEGLIQELQACSTARQMSEVVKNAIYEAFSDGERLPVPTKRGALVAKIEAFLQRHYPESDLSVDRIAAGLFFENSYLRRVYKLQTGITIMQRLEEIRIAHAQSLLRQPGMRHAEIAEQTGFSDASYFSRRFKLSCGCTPSEYQAKYSACAP